MSAGYRDASLALREEFLESGNAPPITKSGGSSGDSATRRAYTSTAFAAPVAAAYWPVESVNSYFREFTQFGLD